MKQFVVAFIDWSDNELRLEKVEAADWRNAVHKHTKYPWHGELQDDPLAVGSLSEDDFKQQCFDCDCLMNWIEL